MRFDLVDIETMVRIDFQAAEHEIESFSRHRRLGLGYYAWRSYSISIGILDGMA
jgi:hypothetical protein